MKFNDEVISHIAKILQMALITGTDIVDHLRMVVITEEEGELFLDPEYSENYDKNISKMIDEVLERVGDQEEGS